MIVCFITLSLWCLHVEALEHYLLVKNEAIPELLQLEGLFFANFDLCGCGLRKVQVGAQLYREGTVLLYLPCLLEGFIVEDEAVKERDLSSCIKEGILRALEELSWLLNRILGVIENGAIQNLSLIHWNNHDWVAPIPRRLPFFALAASPENAEEVEAAIRFGVALGFLGSFLLWKRFSISNVLGSSRQLGFTPF